MRQSDELVNSNVYQHFQNKYASKQDDSDDEDSNDNNSNDDDNDDEDDDNASTYYNDDDDEDENDDEDNNNDDTEDDMTDDSDNRDSVGRKYSNGYRNNRNVSNDGVKATQTSNDSNKYYEYYRPNAHGNRKSEGLVNNERYQKFGKYFR